jgi:hypothetical protein
LNPSKAFHFDSSQLFKLTKIDPYRKYYFKQNPDKNAGEKTSIYFKFSSSIRMLSRISDVSWPTTHLHAQRINGPLLLKHAILHGTNLATKPDAGF